MSMKEAQTRSALIDPVLDEKGWSRSPDGQDYWIPEVAVYPGRIDSEGNHRDPGAADYVLYCGREPMAVIEAKAEGYSYDTPADVIGLYDDLQRKLYELSAEEVAV